MQSKEARIACRQSECGVVSMKSDTGIEEANGADEECAEEPFISF